MEGQLVPLRDFCSNHYSSLKSLQEGIKNLKTKNPMEEKVKNLMASKERDIEFILCMLIIWFDELDEAYGDGDPERILSRIIEDWDT